MVSEEYLILEDPRGYCKRDAGIRFGPPGAGRGVKKKVDKPDFCVIDYIFD
jgi:hypothetical protein